MSENCCCSLIRGIASFILGSLRIILFFGCFIFLVIQSIWLVVILMEPSSSPLQIPGARSRLADVIYAASLLMLALLGCYGSFYKHRGSIKMFTVMTAALTVILVLVVVYTMSPEDISAENDAFVRVMHRYMSQYDWADGSAGDHKEASLAWDSLQTILHCCGINGPNDWDYSRPIGVPANYYPLSCCQRNSSEFGKQSYCKKPGPFDHGPMLYTTGCLQQIESMEAHNLEIACLYIGFQWTLCVLSCIVGFFNLEDNYGSGRQLPRNYQTVAGSVYVQPQSVTANMKTPPSVYPNLYEVQGTIYSGTPPPSYGSA